MHRHNRKAVILTAQCHLISVLEVTKLFLTLYFCFPTNAAVTCSTTKALHQMYSNQESESAVIATFEITIIKINYNLKFKRCFIDVSSILTERL